MRGSMFVANPWARHPMRPLSPVLGQTCEGGVCPMNPPADQGCPGGVCPVTPPTTPPVAPSSTPADTSEPSPFPIAPVAAGVGVLVLAAFLLG